jgi:hypothetical protein
VFADLADAQAQLDSWVREYNFERPHQSLGMAVPWDRFRLAKNDVVIEAVVESPAAIIIERVHQRFGVVGEAASVVVAARVLTLSPAGFVPCFRSVGSSCVHC